MQTTEIRIKPLSVCKTSVNMYTAQKCNKQRLQSNLKKYYTEWGKIHSILVLHKSIINEEEKNAK